MKLSLPSDEIMKAMAKIATEKATTLFAEIAESMARDMRDGVVGSVSGPDALDAFARVIRARNAKRYPFDEKSAN